MEFLTDSPSLEAAIYRRDDLITLRGLQSLTSSLSLPLQSSSSSSSSYSLHNHILQGSFLRYIKTRIKSNQQIGQFRLVLVQGKRNGRMEGLQLNSKSDVILKSVNNNEYPGDYMIIVNGYNRKNIDTKWELFFQTEESANTWYDALKKAKDFTDISDANGDTDKLKDIVKKLKEKLNIGNHIYRFKIYHNSFEGSKATQFLTNEYSISNSQAIAIGNRLLNHGLIHHASFEHIFVDKKLLYTFSDSNINQSNTTSDTIVGSDLNYEKVVKSIKSNDINPETENEELFVAALNRCYLDLRLTKIALNNIQADSSKVLELHDTTQTFLDDLIVTIRVRCLVYMVLHMMIMLIVKFFDYDGKVNVLSAVVLVILSIDIYFLQRSAYLNKPTNDIDSRVRILSVDETERANIFNIDDDGSLIDDPVQEDEYDIGDDDNENDKTDNDDFSKSKFDTIRQPVDPALWPNNPVMIRISDSAMPSGSSESKRLELSKPIHIHKPGNPEVSEIEFESDLFIGKMYIIIEGLPDSPHSYFRRKLRKFQSVIQGKFKKRTQFSNVYTGQVLEERVTQLPAKWIVRSALKLFSNLQPAIKVNLNGDKPYLLSPLASAAQKIIVSRPGDEPSVSKNIYYSEEDMSLQSKDFENMDRIRRRAYLSKRANLNKYYFETDLVYTFDFYQHLINLSTFKLELGFIKYDITKILGFRPVQIMAVDWDPTQSTEPEKWPFLYNFEIWHRKSVPPSSIISSPSSIISSPLATQEKSSTT